MRALVPNKRTDSPGSANSLRDQPESSGRLLAPLVDLAVVSDYLVAGSIGDFLAGETTLRIPRFLFLGPKGGGDTLRLGFFAALRGDEPEAAEVLVEFLLDLEGTPAAAQGYHLYVYPVCNPSGFALGTRHNFAGEDLTGHFWRLSSQPEVYYLEREMGVHRFDGVISIHTIDSSGPLVASARGSIASTALARPSLEASRRFLPQNLGVDAPATPAAGDSLPGGFLTLTDELSPAPFEINIGLPRRAPRAARIRGAVHALKALLESYRALQAIQQNI